MKEPLVGRVQMDIKINVWKDQTSSKKLGVVVWVNLLFLLEYWVLAMYWDWSTNSHSLLLSFDYEILFLVRMHKILVFAPWFMDVHWLRSVPSFRAFQFWVLLDHSLSHASSSSLLYCLNLLYPFFFPSFQSSLILCKEVHSFHKPVENEMRTLIWRSLKSTRTPIKN